MNYLEDLIHPGSIAIVGASANPTAKGYDYLKGTIEFGFPGNLYPVNPKATEMLGLKAFPCIRDIPRTIDYAISCIPAEATLQLVEDCASKGAKVLQLYTAGFSETGEEEGRRLEEELVRRAHHNGMRIIGPNCIGVHYPKGGLAFGRAKFAQKSGEVGCLVQSGGHAWTLVCQGSLRGIRFSKVFSFGNASDLNESDFLEYLAEDQETRVIAAYIEGVKSGHRFLKAVIRAAVAKPVIIVKGGRTEAGMRAVASHTGALAGSDLIWDAILRQAGTIRVYNIDELIDTILPFVYFPPVKGHNVGIVGVGGGASVQAADDCEAKGLVVPHLPLEIRERLKEFIPLAGSSLRNPVDAVGIWGGRRFLRILEIVAAWDKIDFLVAHATVELTAQWQGQNALEGVVDSLLAAQESVHKPMVVILHSYGTAKGLAMQYDIQKRFVEAKIPIYPTIARAASAISNFCAYQNRIAAH